MAALQAVRAELEVVLGSDENWRALYRTGEAGLDRRDRDARLVRALEANPLYVAWTHVSKAISALHDGDQAAELAETEDDRTRIRGITPSVAALLAAGGAIQDDRELEAPWADGDDPAVPIELPEDIRERIRADAAGDSLIMRPTRPSEEREPAAAEVREPIGTGTLGRKLAAIPSLEPVEAAPHTQSSSRPADLEADTHEPDEVIEAPSDGVAEPLIEAPTTPGEVAELLDEGPSAVEEPATVAMPEAFFRRRDGQGQARLRPGDPAHGRTCRGRGSRLSAVTRRLRPRSLPPTLSDPQATGPADGFVPAVAGAEEEVTIIKPEDPATAPYAAPEGTVWDWGSGPEPPTQNGKR
jgi:hypothetical protein